jgi:hypothetical protein
MEPHLKCKRGSKDRPDFGNSERYCQWAFPFATENQSIAKRRWRKQRNLTDKAAS